MIDYYAVIANWAYVRGNLHDFESEEIRDSDCSQQRQESDNNSEILCVNGDNYSEYILL